MKSSLVLVDQQRRIRLRFSSLNKLWKIQFMATENVSQDSDFILSALEQQRLKIARDLHDEVGSGLTSLKLELSWIERHAEGKIAKRARDARNQLSSLADAGHRLLGNLRAPRTDADFVKALRSQIDRVAKQSNLAIDFHCQLNAHLLSEATRDTIYFTILESLTNVQRHAQASTVQVSIVAYPGYVSLMVVDDGIGLPHVNESNPCRYGLLGLRERAKQVDGTFNAWSMAGSGTTACLRIPLQSAVHAPAPQLHTDELSI